MSKQKAIKFLILPGLFGLLVTLLVYSYWPETEVVVDATDMEMVSVVVAREDLEAGMELSPKVLMLKEVPAEYLTSDTFGNIDELSGMYALAPVLEGEPVRSARVTDRYHSGKLAYVIPEGMRAVSFRANEIIGVGGFIEPGNYVDIIVTYQNPERENVASLILEEILVLAVERELEEWEEGIYSYLTVAVTPKEAVHLVWADEFGDIRLLLRPLTAEGQKIGLTSIVDGN